MRDQLIRYVDLLFAGASDADDIKQEILQNTLDRYDDLVAQGKASAAAYSLAIAGIGDISEILGNVQSAAEPVTPSVEPEKRFSPEKRFKPECRNTPAWKKALRAVAVCLYIISIIPLIILSEFGMDIIGLCGMLAIVAVATALIIIAGGNGKTEKKQGETANQTPQQELRAAVKKAISTVGLVIYFIVSFTTQAWYITWLIFPIMAAVQGIVNACFDLKEVHSYES